MNLVCPHCNHSIDVPEARIGQSIQCPNCGQFMVVPRDVPPARNRRPSPPMRPVFSPATSYVLPKQSQSSGLGKFLLFLLAVIVGGFIYATYHFNESPQAL